MADQLSREQLVRLAQLGAAARLEELKGEITAIEALLSGRRGRGRPAGRAAAAAGATPSRRRGRRRRSWTAAQREEARARMKRYWAGVKAGKNKRKAGSKK